MSQEKIDLLRAFGAKVIVTPTAVAPDHPANYVKVAERIVKEIPNSFMLNQYFNLILKPTIKQQALKFGNKLMAE